MAKCVISLTIVYIIVCMTVNVSSYRHAYREYRASRIKRQSDEKCPVGACANGGTCVVGEGGYSCLCPPGFTPQSLCKDEEGR